MKPTVQRIETEPNTARSSTLRTSTDWCRYFHENARSLLEIPWSACELTRSEAAAVTRSIQDFQTGESSEGRHLRRYARDWARKTGDFHYVDAIRFFLAEEHRHARDLGRFLTHNGIPLRQTNFPDRVFRKLRNLFGGLDTSISVLLAAEIVAEVYYPALERATRSPALRRLCEQVLRDEAKHVEFQSEQLARLRVARGPFLAGITQVLQRVLFAGTCLVVWVFHRRVFRAARLSFPAYLNRCRKRFARSARITRAAVAAIRLSGRFRGSLGNPCPGSGRGV